MIPTGFDDNNCDHILEYLDSSSDLEFRDDAAGLLRHVETCPACTAEIQARRELRDRLRAAVRGVETPENLERRVQAAIRPRAGRMISRPWMMALAACFAIAFGVNVAYQFGSLRFTAQGQNDYISSISFKVPPVIAIGLQDHVHCAFYRKYPKEPPSNQSLLEKLGVADSGLLAIVQQNVPSGFKAMLAHHCGYQGRQYTHITMQSDSNLMSLVIARKGEGESMSTSGMLSVLSESGIPMYTAGVQRFRVAAFETREHLVYVVSDLSAEKNSQLLLAMAVGLKSFLDKQES